MEEEDETRVVSLELNGLDMLGLVVALKVKFEKNISGPFFRGSTSEI